MKRKKALTFLLLFVLLLTAGCTNQRYEIGVEEDGKAYYSQEFAIDYDIYQELLTKNFNYGDRYEKNPDSEDGVSQLEPYFQETAELFRAKKFEITPIDDSVQVGFKVSKEYEDVDSLNNDLKLLYQSGLSGLKAVVSAKKGVTGEKYEVYGDLKFLEDEDFDLNEKQIDKLFKKYGNPRAEANLYVKTPGNLDGHEGTIDSGKVKITALYGSAPVEVYVSSGRSSSQVKIIIGIIGFVGIVVGLLFLSRKISQARLKRGR